MLTMKKPDLKIRIIFFVLLLALAQSLISCQTVKPYQRIYLNDRLMQLGHRPLDKFGEKFHAYRESAAGGGTGKSSGGCGCN
jgi:hypothetical protein